MAGKQVLISFKTRSTQQMDVFRKGIEMMSGHVQWTKISSIYRVRRRAESFSSLRHIKGEELLEGFACVGLGLSKSEPHELMQQLLAAEESLSHEVLRRSLSCNFLAMGDEMVRFPELTLPHPEFHLRPEELIPASEVWPDYVHPVLQKSIRELARSYLDEDWGEYHCAGSPLLDR